MKASIKNHGFAMPMILTFIVLLGVVGAAIVQNSVQTNGSAVLHSQVQIAHIASKAAIDYAEEQFELNAAYSGTAEQDLFLNDNYRATIEVIVLYNQGSTAKRIQGIGRVYIPETSSSAKVVRDIKSTIIRNGEVIIVPVSGEGGGTVTDPSSFNPLLWLDANEPNSLYLTSIANSQTISSISGSGAADVVEERGLDAYSSPGSLSFNSSDLEMAYDGSYRGHQTIGLRFRGINVPNSTTIQDAFIQFQTDETKSSGYVRFIVEGVASDNSTSWSGNYAVSASTKTTTNITWTPANWNSIGASGATERLNVTSIVQELVNRSGWTPGNAMSFGIKWDTGSGIRTAESGTSGGGPELFVQWDAGGGGGEAVNDNDGVSEWYDKSGNSNTSVLTYGTAPVLKLNQVNGLNAVRFSANGTLMSSLSPSVSDSELVAFMVMRPRTTSSSNARFLSLMRASQSNDYNTSSGLIPFMKNGTSTTIQQYYNNNIGRSIASAIDDTWSIYSSRLSNAYSERLIKNSTPDNYNSEFGVSYTIDQIYLGGRRSGAVGTDFADMDVAEVIVYDRVFVCSEIQQIENYLADKYAMTISQKDPCP